jgi:hypothetical protein
MQPQSVTVGLMRSLADGDAAQLSAMRGLRDEIVRQQDRIEELEGLLGLRVRILPRVKMTPTGRLIFGVLLKAQGWTSTATLVTAIYGSLPDCDWPRDSYSVLKVHICKLRASLRPYGVEFDTIFGASGCGGYFMPPEMKAIARALIIQESARGACPVRAKDELGENS